MPGTFTGKEDVAARPYSANIHWFLGSRHRPQGSLDLVKSDNNTLGILFSMKGLAVPTSGRTDPMELQRLFFKRHFETPLLLYSFSKRLLPDRLLFGFCFHTASS